MRYDTAVQIGERQISIATPTYFIADIAANHDGCEERAKELIWLAKEAKADAVKFQHFRAGKIVSNYGFENLGKQVSHQSSWKKSVYEIYQQYECNREWNESLVQTAKEAGIDFLTTPYDYEAVDMFERDVPAYKIGSGDITWTQFISAIARKGKPVLLATGAADINDVERAVGAVLSHNRQLVLMQCNTNYTGSPENFQHVNLKVLRLFDAKYPGLVLGLSDHTPGHATVLGAIALGARVIEKHFTDDNLREGPDHPFSLNPPGWRSMVDRSRELEAAMGDGVKRIEANEQETVVIQRRCVRLTRSKAAGDILGSDDLECLRPAKAAAYLPYQLPLIIGKKLTVAKAAGDALFPDDLGDSMC